MKQWVEQEAEMEKVVEVGLQGRRPRLTHHTTTTTTTTAMDFLPTNVSATLNGARKGEYEGRLDNSVYFDNHGVEWYVSKTNPGVLEDLDAKLNNLDVQKVQDDENRKGDGLSGYDLPLSEKSQKEENKSFNPISRGETEHEMIDLIDESEEEVIELEFEMAIKKMDTHTMHCPNCNSHITKVVLRRKRANKIAPPTIGQEHEPVDLLGCLSCFSLFIPTGSGFNLFRLFGNGRKNQSTQVPQQIPVVKENIAAANENSSTSYFPNDQGKMVILEQGDCFSLFGIFRNRREKKSSENPQQISAVEVNYSITSPTYVNGNKVIEQEKDYRQHVKEKDVAPLDLFYNPNDALPGQNGHAPPLNGQTESGNGLISDHMSVKPHEDGKYFGVPPPRGAILHGDVRLDVHDVSDENVLKITRPTKPVMEIQNVEGHYTGLVEGGALIGNQSIPSAEERMGPSKGQGSKSLEILKSIVYGGLMESIASLSVVSSAAGSDATTLNIIALGLANLIGGLFIIGHNLWDLKDDRYGGDSDETNQQANKYQELLGRRENFPLHATVAVLSFLVFGLIPPVTYGFSFPKSDDRDLKIVAVAAASLLCVILLAVGKAYIGKTPMFYMYFKTVLYYVTTAIMVSGVSFVVGHLIKKLMEKLGLFEMNSVVTPSLPEMKSGNPSWASY